jgi:hydrogenase small subunit
MSPFYERLPKPPGFGVTTNADQIGLAIVGATAVGFGAHGVAKVIQHKSMPKDEEPKADAERSEGGDQV